MCKTKKYDFWILGENSTFFKVETQNKNGRITTKTILRNILFEYFF